MIGKFGGGRAAMARTQQTLESACRCSERAMHLPDGDLTRCSMTCFACRIACDPAEVAAAACSVHSLHGLQICRHDPSEASTDARGRKPAS